MSNMETYYGYVRTPADAIKLFEACRLGLLPRVQRRLSEKERQSIRSGSVFVWDEREAGMRRWTDGKSWSASRVSGSFLTYREMEGKRGGGFGGNRRGTTKTPESNRGSDEDQDNGGPEGYKYKADGLMKQSFSITTSANQHLHLISYYARPHPGAPELMQPTADPNLRHINPPKGMYPESSLHDSNPTPALTRAPMVQHPPYMVQQHPLPPQHYPPQYAQPPPGYQWTPSPVPTPPYGHHYTPASYPQHSQQGIPAQNAHQSHYPHTHPGPPPPYGPHPHTYERPTLPPPPGPQPKALAPAPASAPHAAQHPPNQSPRTSQTQPEASPRAQHLQAQAAQAVMMDSTRGHHQLPPPSQGPLPSIKREGSPSAVQSSQPDSSGTGNKTSISSLLQPLSAELKREAGAGGSIPPMLSEPAVGNISPRTGAPLNGMLGPAERPGGSSHDARAIQLLDRKFCT